MSDWTVIRYDDQGWPSHPDEDLPPDGAIIEMWRGRTDDGWFGGLGQVVRHDSDGHATATIRDARVIGAPIFDPPENIPEIPTLGGVVWRLA